MLYAGLLIFFCIGYLAIIFEHILHINKAAVALGMGVICWLFFFWQTSTVFSSDELSQLMTHQIADVAQVVFFLLGAMVIVELIDSHHGFKLITDMLYTSSKRRMLWFIMPVAFFMSAVLDNLTAMIVMVSLLKKMVRSQKDRWIFGALVVIAVNAGGAWTPIGDVTTTLLWIHNKITSWQTIKMLFLPSLGAALIATLLGSLLLKGEHEKDSVTFKMPMQPGARRVLCMGISSLILIPVWKATLGLPPFMGAMIGLSLLWLTTDLMHFKHKEERAHLRMLQIFKQIDFSGILFFLGILLAVGALSAAGILKDFAAKLEALIPSQNIVAAIIGLVSSVIDNIPLVAATIGMYDPQQFPTDSSLWQLIAYAAGTGGSILIIGSAAGVAFMGLEKVDFIWYLRKISWIALLSYFGGMVMYFLQAFVLHQF